MKAESHRIAREALKAIWPEVTGKEATIPELQLAAAQGAFEGGYGLAPYKNLQTGETAVLNNWGAIQAGPPPCGPGAFEATDTHPGKGQYQWCYKRYATPAEGARHMVEHLTVKRPSSWAHMKRGDLDAWAAQMRQKDPISGQGLYFEQSEEGRKKSLEPIIAEIASTFGEPVMVKRGGPVATDDQPPAPGGIATTETSIRRALKVGAGAGLLTVIAAALWRLIFRG